MFTVGIIGDAYKEGQSIILNLDLKANLFKHTFCRKQHKPSNSTKTTPSEKTLVFKSIVSKITESSTRQPAKQIPLADNDFIETVNNIPEQIDEPLVKLMTSEMAKNVPAEWEDSMIKLDTINLDR